MACPYNVVYSFCAQGIAFFLKKNNANGANHIERQILPPSELS